jgi:endoglucanase
MRKVIGIILILISISIAGFVWYQNSQYNGLTRTFSSYTLLSSSWEKYKTLFLNKDGRIIDYQNNSVTTSEGQSYAMLRAVWIDDQDTFDKVWNWTKNDLHRPKDNLLGWQWGKRSDGKYGFIQNGGDNTASDADSDIAFSLILASKRWNNSKYLDDAKKMLSDVWQNETDTINGKRYLVAGNWAKQKDQIVINPSYFSPYEWRVFATVDKKDDWNSLITPAYDLLDKSGTLTIDGKKGVGLPPDWLAIQRKTGAIVVPHETNLTTNNGFDAMRVPWRIALDYVWNKDKRAYTYLTTAFKSYATEYANTGKLASIYSYDGKLIAAQENPARYATALGYFIVADPKTAAKMYQNKIIKLYSNADNSFSGTLPYYEQNWLWFGAALDTKFLIPYK